MIILYIVIASWLYLLIKKCIWKLCHRDTSEVIHDSIKTGDVILVKGKGIGAWFIRIFTWSKYNHVAIVTDYPKIVQAYFKYGVHEGRFNFEDYDVKRFKHKDKVEFFDIRIKTIAKHEIGTKYDPFQIVGFGFKVLFGGNNPFNNPTCMICSELIDHIYHILGYDLYPAQLGDISPDDIASSDLFLTVHPPL
jgi:hypothetical protein